jgi:methionyl-tRNA formyltransferase
MGAEVRPLVFLGTPPAAAVVLERLVDAGFEIAHVVTRPDAKRGRGSSLSPSPVKEVALRLGIPVSHGLEWVVSHQDKNLLGIVVAYGRIIPASILAHTPMINIHFSLLPRWRGAAPVERAILAGDTTTGVCIMDIEETLDTGAVYARDEVAIADTSTSVSLTKELARVGADLLVRTLKEGLGTPTPQGEGETYAKKISSEEQRIDWSMSAVQIHRQVRALRSFAVVGGSRIKILEVALVDGDATLAPGEVESDCYVGTGQGDLLLVRVQPEGKGPMPAADWMRGRATLAPTQFL